MDTENLEYTKNNIAQLISLIYTQQADTLEVELDEIDDYVRLIVTEKGKPFYTTKYHPWSSVINTALSFAVAFDYERLSEIKELDSKAQEVAKELQKHYIILSNVLHAMYQLSLTGGSLDDVVPESLDKLILSHRED